MEESQQLEIVVTLLERLYHLVQEECPRLLDTDSYGEGELSIEIEDFLKEYYD